MPAMNRARLVITVFGALYMTLVVVNNVTDFPTNRAFVEHVFAMDTTFRSPNTMWRAIENPSVALVAYLAIIAWEAGAAAALAVGAVGWTRRAPWAARASTLGWTMMIALFAIGFIAIGGEWFLMWQSQQWNGLSTATNNTLMTGLGLLLTWIPVQREAAP